MRDNQDPVTCLLAYCLTTPQLMLRSAIFLMSSSFDGSVNPPNGNCLRSQWLTHPQLFFSADRCLILTSELKTAAYLHTLPGHKVFPIDHRFPLPSDGVLKNNKNRINFFRLFEVAFDSLMKKANGGGSEGCVSS